MLIYDIQVACGKIDWFSIIPRPEFLHISYFVCMYDMTACSVLVCRANTLFYLALCLLRCAERKRNSSATTAVVEIEAVIFRYVQQQ